MHLRTTVTFSTPLLTETCLLNRFFVQGSQKMGVGQLGSLPIMCACVIGRLTKRARAFVYEPLPLLYLATTQGIGTPFE